MKQTNILLACAAGMSTSFIVSRMMEFAMDSEAVGRIWAVPADDVEYESDYDVILLGPQISSELEIIRRKTGGTVPVTVIPQDLYGKCDGEAILKLALEAAEQTEKPEPAEPVKEAPAKIGNHGFAAILRNSFRMIMPLVLLGSLFSLLNGLPVPAYQNLIDTAGIKPYFSYPAKLIYGFFSVYLAYAAGYQTARLGEARKNAAAAGLITVLVYFIVCPWDSYMEWTDQKGIFTAILCGLMTGRVFSYYEKKDWRIHSSALPPNLLDTYNRFFPGAAAVLAALAVHALFLMTPFGDFQNAVTVLLRAPLGILSANLAGEIILGLVCGILWWFGIHGGNVIMPVFTLLFSGLQMENLQAFQNGLPLPHQITGQVLSIGNGSLPLVLCMLIFSRSETGRSIAKTAVLPSLFGIDEPAYFGFPMIMNPVFLIPWVFGNILVTNIGTYLLQNLGLLPYHSGADVQFMPPFVSNFLGYGYIGVFWGFVLLGILIMINYPFVRKYDRLCMQEEQKEKDEAR